MLMTPINKVIHLGLAILLLSPAPAPAQRTLYDNTPNTRPTLAGDKTVKGYRLTQDGLTIYQADHVFLRLPATTRPATTGEERMVPTLCMRAMPAAAVANHKTARRARSTRTFLGGEAA